MKKLYIKERRYKNSDGDVLVVVETFDSTPSHPYQIVWL